jgi:hypothetical protein
MAIPVEIEGNRSSDLGGPHYADAINNHAWPELGAAEPLGSHASGRAPEPGPEMVIAVARNLIVTHSWPAVR